MRLDALQQFREVIPSFTFTTCVSSPESGHANKGYVTQYLPTDLLRQGETDVYLCGPPPMVEAVRVAFKTEGITPKNLFLEKFVPSEEVPH